MDDDRAAENIADLKAICPKLHMCFALVGKQGRQVTCVIWVGIAVQIKVRERIGKIFSGAARALVNVKSENIPIISFGGQTGHCCGDDQPIADREKRYDAGNGGVIFSAVDACDRGRTGSLCWDRQIYHLTFTL